MNIDRWREIQQDVALSGATMIEVLLQPRGLLELTHEVIESDDPFWRAWTSEHSAQFAAGAFVRWMPDDRARPVPVSVIRAAPECVVIKRRDGSMYMLTVEPE